MVDNISSVDEKEIIHWIMKFNDLLTHLRRNLSEIRIELAELLQAF